MTTTPTITLAYDPMTTTAMASAAATTNNIEDDVHLWPLLLWNLNDDDSEFRRGTTTMTMAAYSHPHPTIDDNDDTHQRHADHDYHETPLHKR